VDVGEVRRRIDSFPVWNYEFDLGGVKTPALTKNRANRHEQRFRYFFTPLVDLSGGSLKGKRVLDLGCNAGFWSLKAIEAGCDFVLGIDGRAMHIAQANLVFEAKSVETSRYHFIEDDIFVAPLQSFGTFDIVLCLGLMYHVSKHVDLMEKITTVNSDVLLIDTDLDMMPGSYFRARWESTDKPLHATDRGFVMSPTQGAVVELVRAFGYEVAVLRPQLSDYSGARRYRQGRRKAFLCAKQSPLSSLPAPIERNLHRPRMNEYLWLAVDGYGALRQHLARKGPSFRTDHQNLGL
jgi:tRNA (mo5U34)-methyltransferase